MNRFIIDAYNRHLDWKGAVHPSRIDPKNEARKASIYGRTWDQCGCAVRHWIKNGNEMRCLECGGDCT